MTGPVLRLEWDGPFSLVNERHKGHWRTHVKERADLRAWAGHQTRQASVRFDKPVVVEAVMTTATRRLPDCDSIAAPVKNLIDGMVDGGAIPNDSPEWLKAITYHAPEHTGTRALIVHMKEA